MGCSWNVLEPGDLGKPFTLRVLVSGAAHRWYLCRRIWCSETTLTCKGSCFQGKKVGPLGPLSLHDTCECTRPLVLNSG